MAKHNKKNRSNITNNTGADTRRPDSTLKSVSLRLPPHLHEIAKVCSENMGLSINGILCMALSEYLHEKGYTIHSQS